MSKLTDKQLSEIGARAKAIPMSWQDGYGQSISEDIPALLAHIEYLQGELDNAKPKHHDVDEYYRD